MAIGTLKVDSAASVTLASTSCIPVINAAVTGTGDILTVQTTLADLATYFVGVDGPFTMTAATATPSAFTSTKFSGFSSTVSGAALMGYGTTNDVALMNRAGTVCLGVGPNTTVVDIPGSLSVVGAVSGAAASFASASMATTITSATPSTTRLTQSEITCTPTTTFAVAAGGSLAGTRGGVTISANKSFTDGFLYGAQGKVTNNGTMAEVSAARIAGVLGQVDLAAGTITAGQVSCLWGDFQGTTPTLTVPDQVNILRLTNSITTGTVNSMMFCYGAATYFAQIGAASGPDYFIATPPTSLAKSLRILVGSTPYYIALYSAAS